MRRISPDKRKQEILKAALSISVKYGYNRVTLGQIAERADTTRGNIYYHFGTIKNLRREILREAVRTKNTAVMAQGVLFKDPVVKGMGVNITGV